MSTLPSVPIINIKPRASYNKIDFYWSPPTNTGINAFTPANIPSLQLWIDANDSSTLSTIGGHTVTQVNDKAKNIVFTPIQNPNGRYLELQVNQVNGNQLLWFNNRFADNVYLQGNFNIPIAGSAFMVMVAQKQMTPARRGIFGSNVNNSPNFSYVNGLPNVVVPGLTNNRIPGTPANTLVPGTAYLIYVSWQGSSTSVGLFGERPVAGTNPAPVTTSGSVLRIAADTALYSELSLGEFIVCDARLNSYERQSMEGYLAWKWGLNSKLPLNHSCYNNDPRTGIAPLLGYILSCPSLPFVSTYSARSNMAGVTANLVRATDYNFSLGVFNNNGVTTVNFQTTQIGLIPSSPTNVQATPLSPTSINVTWSYATQPLDEAKTKWFILTAKAAASPPILKSVHGSERSRAMTDLEPDTTYTITVEAVNDVNYSLITQENTTTVTTPAA